MELIAKENKWLTQVTIANEEERLFVRRITLAHSLTAEDFTEWSEEQKAEWEREHPREGEVNE